ncbi:granzyme A-like [Apodemus sylvaticus]|uniref:granzyme A-like n=1 Tax=Apodemus sylvaticus TaxID=10129 RepID=UPI0022443D9F|nr:granzyme A-like [Apodemus sylvaticus]
MRNACVPRVSALATVFFLLLIPEGGCERIIGGDTVVPHSRPYTVLLKLNSKSICAGALIAKDWVLTAAHCNLGKRSEVILGAHSTKKEPEQQILSVKKAFPNPCFDKYTHKGDLQLLQLNKKATINRNVAVLRLPEKADDVKPGTRCQVAGWGSSCNKSPHSDTLREVNITVIDRKNCKDKKHCNFNPGIGLNMICAESLQGGKDSCNKDSGSPLLCDRILQGIALGLKGKCGDPRGPGVYTFISETYLQWIKKTMKGAV